MIVNKELWGKFDASKLKKNNQYLHQYISAVTDFDNEMHCAYIGNRKAQFHKIGVLMENVIHDMNNDEVTDILTDIVISLFDYHFGDTTVQHKKYMITEMLQECFERLDDYVYEEEEVA